MPTSPFRILLCSAGRRVGLLNCFRAAAERLSLDLEVIACDLDPGHSAACANADLAVPVPHCLHPDYAGAVIDLAKRHEVRLVVPTIDTELLPLARVADDFAASGIRLHVSTLSATEIARDKALTAKVLAAAGIAVPRTLSHAELVADPGRLRWPVIAKPNSGSASRGLQVFEHPENLPATFPEPMVFQDLHRGDEYTVNIFVDEQGQLRAAVPHRRISIRAGEVEKGVTVRRADLREMAGRTVAALPGLRGVACFQVLDDPDYGPAVIEINARFGGGYPLADHAGAPFAQWLLEEAAGLPISAHDGWRENVLMLRYDCAVFNG